MIILGLWLLGVACLCAELFVTSFVAAIVGSCALVASVGLAFHEHGPLAGVALAAGSVLIGAALLKLGARNLALQQPLTSSIGTDDHSSLIGQTGTASTILRPAGYAMIGGKRVDVVTLGEVLDPGTPIEVMDVEGNRIVVRKKG
jgi:membrane-bound serine protease (ClpP class)